MILIAPAGGMAPVRPATARTRAGAGFAVTEWAAEVAGPVACGEVSAAGLLGLQEAEPPEVTERRARRQGQALLAELAALQRDVLSGRAAPERLLALAKLADTMPEAADPRLREAVAGVVLRARVELARRSA